MSSELQHPAPRAASELRGPWMRRHEVRARLAEMARRGEISCAFNPRREGEEYVVSYERARAPRRRTPRLVATATAVLAAPVVIGAMLWHARYALALIGICLLAAAATVGIFLFVTNLLTARSHGGGHCPGAWHK